jgi:hypothetical protein
MKIGGLALVRRLPRGQVWALAVTRWESRWQPSWRPCS